MFCVNSSFIKEPLTPIKEECRYPPPSPDYQPVRYTVFPHFPQTSSLLTGFVWPPASHSYRVLRSSFLHVILLPWEKVLMSLFRNALYIPHNRQEARLSDKVQLLSNKALGFALRRQNLQSIACYENLASQT